MMQAQVQHEMIFPAIYSFKGFEPKRKTIHDLRDARITHQRQTRNSTSINNTTATRAGQDLRVLLSRNQPNVRYWKETPNDSS